MTVTWTALIFVLVMVIATVAVLVKKHWPRDENGEMVEPDEIEKFFDKMPSSPGSHAAGMRAMIVFLATITLLILALSGRSHGANHSD